MNNQNRRNETRIRCKVNPGSAVAEASYLKSQIEHCRVAPDAGNATAQKPSQRAMNGKRSRTLRR
jgi:hypothetical protein